MTAKPSLFPSLGRLLVYAVLALATAFFLLPLYAMLVTSFKDAEEIRSTSLLALPAALNWSAWGTAWQSACTAIHRAWVSRRAAGGGARRRRAARSRSPVRAPGRPCRKSVKLSVKPTPTG